MEILPGIFPLNLFLFGLFFPPLVSRLNMMILILLLIILRSDDDVPPLLCLFSRGDVDGDDDDFNISPGIIIIIMMWFSFFLFFLLSFFSGSCIYIFSRFISHHLSGNYFPSFRFSLPPFLMFEDNAWASGRDRVRVKRKDRFEWKKKSELKAKNVLNDDYCSDAPGDSIREKKSSGGIKEKMRRDGK